MCSELELKEGEEKYVIFTFLTNVKESFLEISW